MVKTEEFKGYLSEEHRKKFILTAGLLGAGALIVQFLAPFIMMIVMMPTMMFFQFDMMKMVDIEKAALLNGEVYYVEQGLAMGGPGQNNGSVLKKISPFAEDAEPSEIMELDSHSPYLLPDNGGLWLISPGEVAFYKDGKLDVKDYADQLADISRPFLYNGKPALIEFSISKNRLLQFNEGNWKELKEVEGSFYSDSIQVVMLKGKPYTLREYGDTVYSRPGVPDSEFDEDDWETVGTAKGDWYAGAGKDHIFFFANTGKYGRGGKIIGRKFTGEKWQKYAIVDIKMADDVSVFETGKENLIICSQGFPGSLRFTELTKGKKSRSVRIGRSSPFPPFFMVMIFAPHVVSIIVPVILAFILSIMMKRFRDSKYVYEHYEMHYASLNQRAVAKIIDAGIAGIPALIGWLVMATVFLDFEAMLSGGNPPVFMLAGFGLIGVGIIWSFMCLFLYSWLEGSYGQTPGKWVTGIKVIGMDINPCGFGRGLIRNLMTIVDNFFSFIVGIMLVALTEHWQRLGDLTARTIVVDVKKGENN